MKRFSRQHIATKADNLKETSKSANRSVQGEYRLLALELCLATMRNLRGPSATRLLEMEINQLEGDLFTLLHRIEICPNGLKIVRSLAQQLLKNLVKKFSIYFVEKFFRPLTAYLLVLLFHPHVWRTIL